MLEVRGDYFSFPGSNNLNEQLSHSDMIALENMEISFTLWLRDRKLTTEELIYFESADAKDWNEAIAFDLFPLYRMRTVRKVRFIDRGNHVEQGISDGWDWSFFIIDINQE